MIKKANCTFLWHWYLHRRDTELTTVACMLVVWCWAVHASMALLTHFICNMLSSDSPPVFLECISLANNLQSVFIFWCFLKLLQLFPHIWAVVTFKWSSLSSLQLRWAWMSPTLIVRTAHMCMLHPGSQDPCTSWNALCISVYWHVYNWTARTAEAICCLPWKLSTKTGRWMCRHMDSAYWVCGAVAARQLATCLCDSETTHGLPDSTAGCDIHIDIGMTRNLLQYLHVICGCRAVQTNSAETSLAM